MRNPVESFVLTPERERVMKFLRRARAVPVMAGLRLKPVLLDHSIQERALEPEALRRDTLVAPRPGQGIRDVTFLERMHRFLDGKILGLVLRMLIRRQHLGRKKV